MIYSNQSNGKNKTLKCVKCLVYFFQNTLDQVPDVFSKYSGNVDYIGIGAMRSLGIYFLKDFQF